MSDTPRTDAGVRMMIDNDISPEGLEYFARDMERELNAANERIKQLEEAGNDLVWWFCQGEPSQLSPTQSTALKQWRDLLSRDQ